MMSKYTILNKYVFCIKMYSMYSVYVYVFCIQLFRFDLSG